MWFAALWGSLTEVMGTMVGRVLISLGMGVISYKSMDISVAWAKDHFFTAAGGLPSPAIHAMGLMQIDTAVEMVCSAILMRLTFKGMAGGVMKKFGLK